MSCESWTSDVNVGELSKPFNLYLPDLDLLSPLSAGPDLYQAVFSQTFSTLLAAICFHLGASVTMRTLCSSGVAVYP